MTLSHRISILVVSLLAAIGITFGAAWLGYQNARGEEFRDLVITDGNVTELARFDGDGRPVVAIDAHNGDRHTFHADYVRAVEVYGKPVQLAQLDMGSASPTAISSPQTTPADKLHDPVSSPQAAFDDLKAAKKLGWGLMVLASLIMVCRVLSRLGGKFKVLDTGRVAVVIGAVGTLAVTAYNALALGGTWMAAASAAVVALAAYWNSQGKPAEKA